MSGSTTSNRKNIHWIYILESKKDKKRYIGYTKNLKKRIKEHQQGKVFSTNPRKPFKLIYLEGCLNEEDAKRREKYFKTTQGRRFLVKRLRNHYSSLEEKYSKLSYRVWLKTLSKFEKPEFIILRILMLIFPKINS